MLQQRVHKCVRSCSRVHQKRLVTIQGAYKASNPVMMQDALQLSDHDPGCKKKVSHAQLPSQDDPG